MFITLTIDTTQKKKALSIKKNKISNPARGWRQAMHVKKRSMWSRIRQWKSSLTERGHYRMDGQTALF